MSLTILNEPHEIISVSATVDVSDTGCRYQVALAHDSVRRIYIISVPNYFVSIETSNPNGCADKLAERGISLSDADAIAEIIKQLLLPTFKEKADS
jgi:hypothetical protein